MKLRCPACNETEVEFVSNLDMERTHKWIWRRWAGEERLLCPNCSKEGAPIYDEDRWYDRDYSNRRGVRVDKRST